MTLALLIALLACVALGVYALRVTGERNIWRDEARVARALLVDRRVYVHADASWSRVPATSQDSPRQRHAQAAAVLADARKMSTPLGRVETALALGVIKPKPKRRK